MASGEYRRPQSDSGVSFRCLRLKCELYLNVCLSISISLCPAHRLFNSFSTLRSTKITLFPSLSLSSLCNRRTYQIACKLTNCQLRFLFLYLRILLLLYGLHTHSKLLCKCSVSVLFFYSLFETCLTTRTTALLIPCLAYGIWHTHDIDATYSALDR